MRRYLLALSVTLSVLLAPSLAYADDGFIGGLQDLVGAREVEQQAASPEQEFLEEYEPEYAPLRAENETEIEEGQEIQAVVGSVNVNPYRSPGSYGDDLLGGIRSFMVAPATRNLYLPAAVGLVFMWWGVRKCIHILMSAFRSGRMSLGGREWNRNSYYYGTKPSDWR